MIAASEVLEKQPGKIKPNLSAWLDTRRGECINLCLLKICVFVHSEVRNSGFLHIHETFNMCPKQQLCGMAVIGSRKTNWLNVYEYGHLKMTVTGSNSWGRVGRDSERHCDPILCLFTQSRNRRRPSCPCGSNTIWMLIACVNVGPILSVLAALCAMTMPASRMAKTEKAQIRKGFDTKILWHPEDTHTNQNRGRKKPFWHFFSNFA